jgi:hypothetical protein
MLAALCLALVFVISLSSYIALCYTSLTVSTRAVAVSHGSEIAEAGIEQALYSMNNSDWSLWTLSGGNATATLNVTANGLQTGGTPLNLGNGITAVVNVTVQNYNTTSPSVTSQAVLTLPSYAGVSTANTVSATATYGPPATPTTAATPVFVNAVAATTGTVRFRTGGTVDSYNSTNPPLFNSYSTYAQYASGPSGPGYSAIVLSQDTSTASATVRLGNCAIHGYASGYDPYSPGSTNWLSYSGTGMVVGKNTAPSNYIDSTRLLTSPVPYQPLPAEILPGNGSNVSMPSQSNDGLTLNQSCTLGTTTATTVILAPNGINLTSGQVVAIHGPVQIICNYGNVTISGTSQIVLTNQYASLQIFLERGSLVLGGNGIANVYATPLPKKVAIVGANNTTGAAAFSTSTPFYGVIYLPHIPITFTGATPVIYGSIVGSSVTFMTSPTIHYDLALRYPMGAYSPTNPLLYGAAFDNLSSPSSFIGLTSSAP